MWGSDQACWGEFVSSVVALPVGHHGSKADYGDLAGVVSVQSFENWIFTVTGVPEPSVVSLLFFGLGGLLLMRGRRK